MTPPVIIDALVEALAELSQAVTLAHDDYVRLGDCAGWNAIQSAEHQVSKLFDTLLAAHQQVTAERDEDRAELARLRAEGEAKDRALKLLLPFVDYAAGEGLMFLGSDDTERPEMDAADLCIAAAAALGLELGDPEFLALVEEGQAAIAARAATAREGQADDA